MGCGASHPDDITPSEALRLSSNRHIPLIFGVNEKFDEKKFESVFAPVVCKLNPKNFVLEKLTLPDSVEMFAGSSHVAMDPNNIYISGGTNKSTNKHMNTLKLFNFLKTESNELEPFAVSRSYHASTILDQKLYIFGGNRIKLAGEDFSMYENPEVGYGNLNVNASYQTSICEVYDINKNQWSFLPYLQKPRAFAQVLIYNNNIYLLGGQKNQKDKISLLKSIEKYSPEEKKWSYHDIKLAYGLVGTTIQLINNDSNVLFLGGNVYGTVSWSHIFNLETGDIIPKLPLQFERSHHKSFIYDNKIYVLGGDALGTIEAASIRDLEWVYKAKLPKDVIFEQLDYNFGIGLPPLCLKSQLKEKKIRANGEMNNAAYVFGTPNNPYILEINFSKSTCEMLTIPYPFCMYYEQSGIELIIDNKRQIFLCGGILNTTKNSVYLYCPSLQTSKKLPPMNHRRSMAALTKNQKKVFVLGGKAKENHLVKVLSECEAYDISSNKWEALPSMTIQRHSAMAYYHNDYIYVYGGHAGEPYELGPNRSKTPIVEVIERYNVNGSEWEIINCQQRYYLSGGFGYQNASGECFVAGGRYFDAEGDLKSSDFIYKLNLSEGDHTQSDTPICKIASFKCDLSGKSTDTILLILGGSCEPYVQILDKKDMSIKEKDALRDNVLNKLKIYEKYSEMEYLLAA